MFSSPRSAEGNGFPQPDFNSEMFLRLMKHVDAELDEEKEILPQAADHALKNLIRANPWESQSGAKPFYEEPSHELFRQVGMVDKILPSKEAYDHALVDGGSMPTLKDRLQFVYEQITNHDLKIPEVTVFGGQRLRTDYDDRNTPLEQVAHELLGKTDAWAEDWLKQQLMKSPEITAKWDRAFASEHEIDILTLLSLFEDKVTHVDTIYRQNTDSIHPDIPEATVHAEVFDVDGTKFQVLNSPAIMRIFPGKQFPISEARPTGKSCFNDWLALTEPQRDSSVLLVCHNPNIYRSWVDILIAREAAERSDLQIESAGPAIEPDRPLEYIRQGFGRLVVGFYNQKWGNTPIETVLNQKKCP